LVRIFFALAAYLKVFKVSVKFDLAGETQAIYSKEDVEDILQNFENNPRIAAAIFPFTYPNGK